MPQLAVKMLRVVALDALPAAEAEIGRSPSREERRERSHVLGRCAAAAEARGETREARFVGQPLGADLAQLAGDDVERLVPRYGHEPRILIAALLRVGALHRLAHPVRVVGLLDQPVGLDADPPAARVAVRDVVVGLDPGRDAVLDFDLHQVGPSDALVAIDRDLFAILDLWGHATPPSANEGIETRAHVQL